MQKGDIIFVYGTLRRGERADLAKQAHNFDTTFIGDDKINGKMYHLGAFPGVKASSGDFSPNAPIVVGELFRIMAPSIITLLDHYEGYDADNPERGLYNRLQTQSEAGRTVWVYTYNGPVSCEQLITSGDWVKNREIPVRNKALEL
jgi:gamma-glutamylcyclotransferase (GGCT)/AIG2-like uncharacterized protein YtfP